jgi:branched-chain amino acid transport system ATP-binding protein
MPAKPGAKLRMEFCFETFLRLKERRRPLAGTRILLVDEPFVGLALILVARMIDKITELTAALGLTVLMAEQNFEQATALPRAATCWSMAG